MKHLKYNVTFEGVSSAKANRTRSAVQQSGSISQNVSILHFDSNVTASEYLSIWLVPVLLR